MRIAFAIFKVFPYGGMQRDFLRIATRLIAKRHEVICYTLEWRGEIPEGLHVNILPIRAWSNHDRYRRFAETVTAILRADGCDCLVGFNKMPGLDVYFAPDPCYAKRMAARPFWHRLSARYRALSAMERAVFEAGGASEILCMVEGQREDFHQVYGTPLTRFHILPPGLSPARKRPADAQRLRAELRAERGLGENDLLMLMVGSGFRVKGLDRALRAFAALPEALRERCYLAVMGDDKAKPFQQLADKLGLRARVDIMRGRDDVLRFMLGADLLIHPAYSELAGIVLLEALAAGLPILTSEVCGYAPHVKRSGGGMVLPEPFSQQALNQTLAEMLVSPHRPDWQRAGLEYAAGERLFGLLETAVGHIENFAARGGRYRIAKAAT